MTNSINNNWKKFIYETLTKSKQFELEDSFTKGQTDIEIYRQLIHNTGTTFKIGYLSGDRLIYLHTFNDMTPGLNKNQIEYFNANDFDDNKRYGKPGLEFNNQNQDGILQMLYQGLNGQETICFKNGKLSHSKLTIVYDNEGQNSFTHIYRFDTISLLTHLKNIFRKQIDNSETTEIDLKKIFGGLK